MQTKKIAGPGAGVYKYDLLTALSVGALHGGQTQQTSVLRLIAMITSRYNWQRDEVSIGQRDLAEMWGVDQRTVKREMKRLSEWGLLTCIRPGVRGRVGAYRLNFEGVERLSRPVWAKVGSDFEERAVQHATNARPPPKVVHVAFGNAGQSDDPHWTRVRRQLEAEQPELFGSWYAQLRFEGVTGRDLHLRAPSGFVCRYIETHLATPLARACSRVFGREVRICLSSD